MCSCYTEQDKWKEYTARGNTEFSLQYFGNAILMYNQALEDARFKFEKMLYSSHDRAISKIVICYFNLADCYIKLNEIDRACDFYGQAQNFLIHVNENTAKGSDELFKAISHADSHVNLVWADFIKKYHDQVGYKRMMQYHVSSQVLQNDSTNAICH